LGVVREERRLRRVERDGNLRQQRVPPAGVERAGAKGERLSFAAIAERLNAEGVPTRTLKP
jgi:hypothetical protein